jgi:hypothetical protein
MILPTSFALLFGAAGTGVLVSKTKMYQNFAILGGILLVAGFTSLTSLSDRSSTTAVLLMQIVLAIGLGVIFPVRLTAVHAAQHPNDLPQANLLLSFSFNVGTCFGSPIASAVQSNRWDKLVRQAVKDGEISANLVIPSKDSGATAEIVRKFPKILAQLYRHIFALATRWIWIFMIGFAAVILLAAIFMDGLRLEDKGGKVVKVKRALTRRVRVQNPEDDRDGDTLRLIERPRHTRGVSEVDGAERVFLILFQVPRHSDVDFRIAECFCYFCMLGLSNCILEYPAPWLSHTVKSGSGFEPVGSQQPTIATAPRPKRSVSCALTPDNPPTTLSATMSGLASKGRSNYSATLKIRCVAYSPVFVIFNRLPGPVITATINGSDVPPTPISPTKRCAAPAKTTRPKADVKVLPQRLHHPPYSILFAPLYFPDTAQPS